MSYTISKHKWKLEFIPGSEIVNLYRQVTYNGNVVEKHLTSFEGSDLEDFDEILQSMKSFIQIRKATS